MTGYSRVFLDTTPLIYFLDEDEHFGEKTYLILSELLARQAQLYTSAITCEEYLVYPYRTGNREKVNAFFELIDQCHVSILPIHTQIASIAARIRAGYQDFKAMDCLQLASAMYTNCDVFLTNDKQLRQFQEIKCVTVEEWQL